MEAVFFRQDTVEAIRAVLDSFSSSHTVRLRVTPAYLHKLETNSSSDASKRVLLNRLSGMIAP